LTDSGGAGKKGKRSKRKPGKGSPRKRKSAKKSGDPGGWRSADLISALNHPLRRRILRSLHESGERSSPARLRERLGAELSCVSYHVTVLVGFGVLKSAGEQPVRGAIEHFYVSQVADDPAIKALLESTKESDEEK